MRKKFSQFGGPNGGGPMPWNIGTTSYTGTPNQKFWLRPCIKVRSRERASVLDTFALFSRSERHEWFGAELTDGKPCDVVVDKRVRYFNDASRRQCAVFARRRHR